jgi:hypothetical protein
VRKVAELSERRGRGRKVPKKIEVEDVVEKEGSNEKEESEGRQWRANTTPKSAQNKDRVKGKSSPAIKSAKVVTPISPVSRRHQLQKKPSTPGTKTREVVMPVAHHFRWTEYGMEVLEWKDTAEQKDVKNSEGDSVVGAFSVSIFEF